MVGILIDLLWLISLDYNMGKKTQIKKKKKRESQKPEETNKYERKFGHPHPHPLWLDLP